MLRGDLWTCGLGLLSIRNMPKWKIFVLLRYCPSRILSRIAPITLRSLWSPSNSSLNLALIIELLLIESVIVSILLLASIMLICGWDISLGIEWGLLLKLELLRRHHYWIGSSCWLFSRTISCTWKGWLKFISILGILPLRRIILSVLIL